LSECDAAAKALGRPCVTSRWIDSPDYAGDPPYCLEDDGDLRFKNGTVGTCSDAKPCLCNSAETAAVAMPYKVQESGTCDHPITILSECDAAAKALGRPSVTSRWNDSPDYAGDPPYCHEEEGELRFKNGTAGTCSNAKPCLCNAAETNAVAVPYKFQESGTCNNPIRLMSECEVAAKALGRPDQTARRNTWTSTTHDPPYCHEEDSELRFKDGSAGTCSEEEPCLCKAEASSSSLAESTEEHWSSQDLDSLLQTRSASQKNHIRDLDSSILGKEMC